MKILITGGFGYLGGRFAQFLIPAAQYDIMLGARQRADRPAWLTRGTVVETLLNSPRRLADICTGVDMIVHLAGMNAQDCVADPVAALEVNAVSTARLLQAAIRQGVKRFAYLSTAHIYGSPLTGEITEETCPASLHPYATSHRAGEDVVRAAHQSAAIEGVVIRLSNAYGAPAHKNVNCWMLLVNDLCRQAVTTGRMILRTSGTQRRDFVNMTDACRAMRHLLELPVNTLGDGVFNVGGGWAPTIMEMAQRIAERVHFMTGDRPGILHMANQRGEHSDALYYGMEKLTNTGFISSGPGDVDREIDALISFCVNQFS